MGEVVTLNVGGRMFTTTRTTLTSEPDSVLARMFDPASPLPPARMIDGAFFIDANPAIFEVGQNFRPFSYHFESRLCWISSVTDVSCFLRTCRWKPCWPRQGRLVFFGVIRRSDSDTLGWRVCCYMVGSNAVKLELG